MDDEDACYIPPHTHFFFVERECNQIMDIIVGLVNAILYNPQFATAKCSDAVWMQDGAFYLIFMETED